MAAVTLSVYSTDCLGPKYLVLFDITDHSLLIMSTAVVSCRARYAELQLFYWTWFVPVEKT